MLPITLLLPTSKKWRNLSGNEARHHSSGNQSVLKYLSCAFLVLLGSNSSLANSAITVQPNLEFPQSSEPPPPSNPVQSKQNTEQDLENQRHLFQAALNALKNSENDIFLYLKKQLADYPLYPYLQYEHLKRLDPLKTLKPLDDFLTHYNQVPVSYSLRRNMLKAFYKQQDWQNYKKYHHPELSDASSQCRFQEAMYHTGSQLEAIENGLKLWNVDKSQVSNCDPLFEILIDKGSITEEIVWQRYSKAVLAHRYELAHYLQRFFKSPRYLSLARRYLSLDRNYHLLGNRDLFTERGAEISAVLGHAIRHQSKDDPREAQANWEYYQQHHLFNTATRTEIHTALSKAFYDRGDAASFANLVAAHPDLLEPNFQESRLRQLITEGNWRMLLAWIKSMPLTLQAEERWQYWYARSSSQLGQNDEAVSKIFKELAQKRNYYGFLASDWLNDTYRMEHNPPSVSEQQILQLADTPAMVRIRELRYHDMLTEAYREWHSIAKSMDEPNLLIAAQLAKRWQWHHQSILTMIRARYWDDIDTRFPILHREHFETHTSSRQLPIHLIMALARQESAYYDRAVSHAGARGLMQLMPPTARETATKHRIPYSSKNELFNPEKNIQLGTQYYRDMLNRFDNNRILATAAYNAGPHRVDRWLAKSQGRLPFDAWIETIPFKETRNYVQNVLAFSAIYAHHLGKEDRILNEKERKQRL